MEKHFRVYRTTVSYNETKQIRQAFIVLQCEDGTLQFTDWHRFCQSSINRIKKVTQTEQTRHSFVVKFLNYAFFCRGITRLLDISIDIVSDFLDAYGMCKLPGDDESTHRSEATVRKCVSTVVDFITLFIQEQGEQCRINAEDLYSEVNKRDKHGKLVKAKVPKFDVRFTGHNKVIFRDMPNSVFEIILMHIALYHTGLLALVILSAFAGLRPSEACNVRREDSPLGHGILFRITDGRIEDIQIDITGEYKLRSDDVSVGGIKKERMQQVPEMFLRSFLSFYEYYMKYMEGRKYEKNYGPLSVNKQGKAITYHSYLGRFHAIIKDEIVPILLQSEDPEVVIYGRMLLEHQISPHIFRHWYTVQLVLSGIDDIATLMYWRGDRSTESALTYLQNKGELEKKYEKVNNEIFDYMNWAAKRQHD